MLSLLQRRKVAAHDLLTSQLFDQTTFYGAFLKDLGNCRAELVIESPFITSRRLLKILPILQRLTDRGIKVMVNTRDPQEHEDYLSIEASEGIASLQAIGAQVLYTGGHHRKLAIVDRKILYEGSLNILSQSDSCEIMRRIESGVLARDMFQFLNLGRFFRH
jgi:PLD-like domain